MIRPSKASNSRHLAYLSMSIGLGLYSTMTMSMSMPQPAVAQSMSSGYSMNSAGQSAPKGALGLVVNWKPQSGLVVTNVVPGGPAARAGIVVGDRLLAIDGTNVQNLPVDQVFQRILGAVGTTTSLSLASPTRGNYEAKVTRVTIDELKKSGNFNIGWQPATDNNTATTANTAGSGGSYGNTSSSNFDTTSQSISSNSSGSLAGSANTWDTYGSASNGFSVKYPKGWKVNQDEKTGKIEIASPAGSNLSVFPFFLPSNNVNINQAKGLFKGILKQYASESGQTWSEPTLVGGALRATSTANNIASMAGLALSGSTAGTAGRLILFQVPNNPSAQSEFGYLPQILQSLTITGSAMPNDGAAGSGSGQDTTSYAGGTNSAAVNPLPYENVQFTKFVDPNFGAFSLDVPAGWNVIGAMKKPMAIDLRPWVKATAPDEKIMIFIGDGSITPRYLPANWLNFLGCPPGSNYVVSNGLHTKVLYYQNAEKFVKDYAKSRLGKACESFELVNVEHHPDLAKLINGTQGVVASDAASAKYNFSAKGTNGVAYFLAATKKGRSMWWVSQICGVVAAPEYEAQARDIFLRMYQSWQYNPQWTEAQNNQSAQSTRDFIVRDRAVRAQSARAFSARMAAMDARHNAFMARSRASDAAHASYMNRVRSSDRAHSDFINYIHDEDTLVNPSTGTQYQVEYGPKYHWINSTGDTTYSTDSAWSPGVNWTELVTPPRP